MPKNKRELKVGDYVRISRTAKKQFAPTVFGNVGVIIDAPSESMQFYRVSALNKYTKGTDDKLLWCLDEEHLKYAKQANKKAGRNVAVK